MSRPQIIDINRDGLLDLVLGERNGNLNYFENKGTKEQASFPADPNNNFFGKVDVRAANQITGYSAPKVLEIDGAYQIFTGNEAGKILRYGDIEQNLDGTFTLIDEDYGAVNLGSEIQFDFADIDTDGFLEIVIGNFRGGISFFKTNLKSERTSLPILEQSTKWKIYPNPLANSLSIELAPEIHATQIKVYNAGGQIVQQEAFTNTLDLSNLAKGVYLIEVRTKKGLLIRKFSKQ